LAGDKVLIIPPIKTIKWATLFYFALEARRLYHGTLHKFSLPVRRIDTDPVTKAKRRFHQLLGVIPPIIRSHGKAHEYRLPFLWDLQRYRATCNTRPQWAGK
jgi:hypothetical protein